MNTYFWIIFGVFFAALVFSFYRRYKLVAAMSKAPVSDKLIILTDATFKKQIAKGVALVDFWAEWCTPCKIQGPVVSEMAEEISDQAKICKLDVQHNQRIATELGIRNIPTIIIFKDGKPFKKFVGVKPKPVLMKAVKNALKG
jgi:thioredoxin 1